MSETMAQIHKAHPMKAAWDQYKATDSYLNTKKWASFKEHTEGSLWASFSAGYDAALARVAELKKENARMREALENSSAALQAVSDRFNLTENEVVKFTGKWASRGSITIGDILDQSATALAKEPEE